MTHSSNIALNGNWVAGCRLEDFQRRAKSQFELAALRASSKLLATMELSEHAEQVLFATTEEKPQSLATGPSVFVFNPFAEEYIAQGKGFAPVKHQSMLAEDLANLPQFLCEPGDIVLSPEPPSLEFLNTLKQAGFPSPEFVGVKDGRIPPESPLFQRKLGRLRPWAWSPDSLKLFEPLLSRTREVRSAEKYFNRGIAELYSKAWSAEFLRKFLAGWGGEPWFCTEQEAGVAVETVADALEAVAAIRKRGHHRVVIKEAYGFSGANSIRLWEPEILPAQRQWLAHAEAHSRQLVVEPWLEREVDFSIQLEMEPHGLKLCGYTGLLNGRKGQFLANWAEPYYARCLPGKVAELFGASAGIQQLYNEMFSLLEAELQRLGFLGPISIDAFVYRTPRGECRLKPVVEINPRYTMGRLTLELMRNVAPGSTGVFRLVNRVQARTEGYSDFADYAHALSKRFPLRFEGTRIREGAICLNDPARAQVCLATFEVGPKLNVPRA
jgi:hypothetical protein